jgi:hypothetical protein
MRQSQTQGVAVRKCYRAVKRLRELAAEGRAESNEKLRKFVELFVALWERMELLTLPG